MSPDDGSKTFHLEHGIPVFNTKLDEIKQAQEAARERENEYKSAQLSLDNRMVRFTKWLVVVTAITGAINVWQATISRESAKAARVSAEAAKRAADIANLTLGEMKKGGTDTHDLAVAANAQAIAANTQSETTKKQAGIMGQQIALAQEVERAWVGIDGEIIPKNEPPVTTNAGVQLPVLISPRLQNFGQSVARRVEIEFKLDDSPMSLMGRDRQWRQTAAPLCETAEKKSLDPQETAVSIFPGSSQPTELRGFSLTEYSPTHVVLIIGCIVYQDQGRGVHHTRVVYRAEFNGSFMRIVDKVFTYPEVVRFKSMDVDAD
jgi:hypothetical protein